MQELSRTVLSGALQPLGFQVVSGAGPTADQSFLTTMDHSLGVVVGVGVLQQST